MKQYGLIGTYKNKDADGIFLFSLDDSTGELDDLGRVAFACDAKYLARHNDMLVSTCSFAEDDRKRGALILYKIMSGADEKQKYTLRVVDRVSEGEGSACYVTFAGGYVVSANYHEGTVRFYELQDEKFVHRRTISFGLKAGTHQVLESGGWFYIPCLLKDRIYVISPALEIADEIPFPAGSGPRHGILSPDGQYMWVVGELDDRLYILKAAPQNGEAVIDDTQEKDKVVQGSEDRQQCVQKYQICRSLPISREKGAHPAAVRLSRDGGYLYISVREENVVSVWQTANLTDKPDGTSGLWQQLLFVGGNHPRDMVLSPDDRYVLAANKESGTVTCFRRQPDGMIGSRMDTLKKTQAVVITFLE